MAASIASYAPYIVSLTLILLFIAFATEIRPPEVTAIAAVGVLLVLGIISTDDLLAAMSNSAPLTIAAMFIISASLVRTGTLEVFARKVAGVAKRTPVVATALLLVTIAAMSAFTNNTPLVMMMIPIGITLAKQLGEPSSKMLMPVSFAAILGGTCTLIGTSTNILVDGVAQKSGLKAFSIFEIAPAGIIIAIVGVAYIALTRHFLPDRGSVASLVSDSQSKRYSISVFIGATSPYIGRKISDVNSLKAGERRLVDLIRNDESLRDGLNDNIIEQGDIIVLHSNETDIMTIREQGRLSLKTDASNGEVVPVSSHQSVLAEILLLPGANIIGQRLDEMDLLQRYGVYPIALHRRGINLMERYEHTPLAIGDTLLFEGATDDLQRLVDGEI